MAEWLVNLKKTLSCSCGESDYRCLDFHHRDPATKKHGVADAVKISIKVALLEIAKCDVLCANCHRKEHRL